MAQIHLRADRVGVDVALGFFLAVSALVVAWENLKWGLCPCAGHRRRRGSLCAAVEQSCGGFRTGVFMGGW